MPIYHTYLTILIPAIFAFVSTVIAISFLMPYMLGAGINAIDFNKKSKPVLPCGMGTALSFGFSIGLLVYIFGASFMLYKSLASETYIFAAIISLLLIALVGFIDDINVRREMVKATGMMNTKLGLKQWQKPLLTFIGAIPLMAINAGASSVHLPFIGIVNLGIIYPIIVIPLAVIFAANAFNLLGGFNGISTFSGLFVAIALLIYSLIWGNYTGTIISAILTAVLLGFLIYDNYPAKIIPGDSYTYAVGAGLVIAMILGNMESFGIIVFMPWIIEFILHAKGKFDITDLGKRRSDGTFAAPYGKKIYSWTHIIMNLKPMKEWEVTMYMSLITLLFIFLAFGLKILGFL